MRNKDLKSTNNLSSITLLEMVRGWTDLAPLSTWNHLANKQSMKEAVTVLQESWKTSSLWDRHPWAQDPARENVMMVSNSPTSVFKIVTTILWRKGSAKTTRNRILATNPDSQETRWTLNDTKKPSATKSVPARITSKKCLTKSWMSRQVTGFNPIECKLMKTHRLLDNPPTRIAADPTETALSETTVVMRDITIWMIGSGILNRDTMPPRILCLIHAQLAKWTPSQ